MINGPSVPADLSGEASVCIGTGDCVASVGEALTADLLLMSTACSGDRAGVAGSVPSGSSVAVGCSWCGSGILAVVVGMVVLVPDGCAAVRLLVMWVTVGASCVAVVGGSVASVACTSIADGSVANLSD